MVLAMERSWELDPTSIRCNATLCRALLLSSSRMQQRFVLFAMNPLLSHLRQARPRQNGRASASSPAHRNPGRLCSFCVEGCPGKGPGASATRVDSWFLHGLASGPPQPVQRKKTAVLLLLQTLALGASSLALDYLIAQPGASSLSITICHSCLLSCT